MPPSKRKPRPPRRQWDGVHPGPVAQQIKPTLVGADMTRYKIRTQTATDIFAWVRVPSDEQLEMFCVACTSSHHSQSNALCKNGRQIVKSMKLDRLYTMKDPRTPIEGRWCRVEFVVPPRYKSGLARFTRIT